MRYLITGGSGFVGSALCADLLSDGHQVSVLTRSVARSQIRLPAAVDLLDRLPVGGTFDAVVNLAGQNIAGGRWTNARKRELRRSRVETTGALIKWMRGLTQRPAILVSASAVGYYGNRGDETLSEDSSPGSDFAAQLCVDWEHAAREAEVLGVRVCRLRIGIVLGNGGALSRLLMPFRLGLGGRIGSGQQWMSWIHIGDLVRLTRWLVENGSQSDHWNATAPTPVRNVEFTRILARSLGRPALVPAPAVALQLALGEMSSILLGGQRVVPARALAGGFKFRHPALDAALASILMS